MTDHTRQTVEEIRRRFARLPVMAPRRVKTKAGRYRVAVFDADTQGEADRLVAAMKQMEADVQDLILFAGAGQFDRSAAVALGRRGGIKGGPARAAALSPERRSEIARAAANARWNRAYGAAARTEA